MPTPPEAKTGPRGREPMGQPPDLSESVAGEEDPGAAVDLAADGSPGPSVQPAGRRGDAPAAAQAPTSPGDEAPVGTAGTGEGACPRCGGSGTLAGKACPACEGTGRVNVGIGGV